MKPIATLAALLPTAALAHPGHGAEEGAHWFTQADHLALIGAGLVLAVVLLVARSRP